MPEPFVKLQFNNSSEATPGWLDVSTNEELVWVTSGTAMSFQTGQDQIPFITKPTTGISTVSQLWIGKSGDYKLVKTYGDPIPPNINANVVRWAWDNAQNSAMVITKYSASGSRLDPVDGDGSILGGASFETSNRGYEKAIMVSAAPAINWASATTGSTGAVSAYQVPQDLKADKDRLETPGTIHTASHTIRLNLVLYVGSGSQTGTFTPTFSAKYTWT